MSGLLSNNMLTLATIMWLMAAQATDFQNARFQLISAVISTSFILCIAT